MSNATEAIAGGVTRRRDVWAVLLPRVRGDIWIKIVLLLLYVPTPLYGNLMHCCVRDKLPARGAFLTTEPLAQCDEWGMYCYGPVMSLCTQSSVTP